eukprot:TRINITY_DN6210_c0_g1_i1.p1 TRINITY_DN6210_c0_g1~~TRINITY_DN6210_c0_g1_i1.p1  ORF type:complete len:100 (-),score=15.26 TRINITY_DN6210_c0_g1_i1:49-303(-)
MSKGQRSPINKENLDPTIPISLKSKLFSEKNESTTESPIKHPASNHSPVPSPLLNLKEKAVYSTHDEVEDLLYKMENENNIFYT